MPLADLRTGVEVGQRGDEPQLILREAAGVDLHQFGLDDLLALGRQWLLQQGVQVGPEHAAVQAGLQLSAVIAHQEEVIVQHGRGDVSTGAGSPWSCVSLGP